VLFHYHFWTPHLEDMENFYKNQGFRVNQRLGKFEGTFQPFNPPLTWDDFKDKRILFRIIEMKKGNMNISFGYGKRVIFDHIGFLVTEAEKIKICENANVLNWKVEPGERRTFINTPHQFLIELQTHMDAIDGDGKKSDISKMVIATPTKGLKQDLAVLFGQVMQEIDHIHEEQLMLKSVKLSTVMDQEILDPNGVQINF
jgi:hypothetical protein